MKNKIIKKTPFGPVGIIWTRLDNIPKIIRVLLSKPGLSVKDQVSGLYPNLQTASCSEIELVADAICGILEGNHIEISLDVANLASCSEFQQSVLRAEHRIPRGSVSTYRLIATHLGRQNGARAVGNALATNPFPVIVPCHRAIRSDLHLGGYQGGLAMKRVLLEKEGIQFDHAGRVVCNRFYYEKKMSKKEKNRVLRIG
jgi:methylated-DNA-[protein]-cysteine S-methyltransferase